MSAPRHNSHEVRVPASTANLGSGFDCLGLALELFLSVRATVLSAPGARTLARTTGVPGSSLLPRTPDENLILRSMRFAADREGLQLPPVRVAVHNEIPVAGGLGSSAAATVAGVALGFAVCGRPVPKDTALQYAAEMEGHTDNVAAALLGGFVVTLNRTDGRIIALRKPWPKMIRLIVVTPAMMLETKKSRGVLAPTVRRADAVHNLQRSALFVAALEERRFDLLWEAMGDKLHQDDRQSLVPGLADILAMPRTPGLLGVALSGAGPSVLALATERFDEIGKAMAALFERHHVASTVRVMEAAQNGLTTSHR